MKISRKDAQERSTKEALQNKRIHKSFLSIRQMIQQVLWQNIEYKWVKGEKEICPSFIRLGQCSDKLCKSYISRIYVALLKMLIPNYMSDLDGKIYKALILLNATQMTLRRCSLSCRLNISRQHPCLPRNYISCPLQLWYFHFRPTLDSSLHSNAT